MDIAVLISVALTAYLIGSIPFGLLLTKAAGLGDIRQIGSGNIGATNVLRTGRKGLALLTLLLDGLKGFLAIWLAYEGARLLISYLFKLNNPQCFSGTAHGVECIQSGIPTEPFLSMLLAAVFVVIGHIFPIWLKFKGGKGVATALGACIGLNPFVGVATCLAWLFTAILFRWSSLASLVAMISMPGFAWYLGNNHLVIPLILIALLVIFRHRENIIRLKNGTEPKIGQKK
jgi:glycerol-3-phosphate acyltransferase PlsY